MVVVDDLHEQYKDLTMHLWVKYHIIPDITIKYLQYRQLGRRKARMFLDSHLKKIISTSISEEDEEIALVKMRAEVLEEINEELKHNPLPWVKGADHEWR